MPMTVEYHGYTGDMASLHKSDWELQRFQGMEVRRFTSIFVGRCDSCSSVWIHITMCEFQATFAFR